MEERIAPPELRELAAYLRREYDSGTEPGYALAAMSNSHAERHTTVLENGGTIGTLGAALRTVLRGKRPSHRVSPEPADSQLGGAGRTCA